MVSGILNRLDRRAHQSNGQDKCGRSSGSLAKFAAMRRAALRINNGNYGRRDALCYLWFTSAHSSTPGTISGDNASLLAAWILQDESRTRHLPRLSAITLTEADAVCVRCAYRVVSRCTRSP